MAGRKLHTSRIIPLLVATGHCERSAAIKTRMFVATAVLLLTLAASAAAKYSGGMGLPNDPYQIATAADLIALGNEPNDYDKHFILTADIDLDPNLPGRKVFDKAVIAPNTNRRWYWGFVGTPFTGVFNGNAHTVSHMTIEVGAYVGLFGYLASGAEVKNLGVIDVKITAWGVDVGGLVGRNDGTVSQCYSMGTVIGDSSVGGLVGGNGGTVIQCYSTAVVNGIGESGGGGRLPYYAGVGGLVGENGGTVTQCYSAGATSGDSHIGNRIF